LHGVDIVRRVDGTGQVSETFSIAGRVLDAITQDGWGVSTPQPELDGSIRGWSWLAPAGHSDEAGAFPIAGNVGDFGQVNAAQWRFVDDALVYLGRDNGRDVLVREQPGDPHKILLPDACHPKRR
jgi:hypothetical protein